jgi:hypothetical protein
MTSINKQFDLSKRIIILPDSNDLPDELKTARVVRSRDIKEFIRELKELLEQGKSKDPWGYWMICGDYEGLIKKLDKLLGDKLK